MRFHSTIQTLRALPSFPPEVVREERSQCRVSCAVARRAGPVHRAFLDALPAAWRADPTVEIFSRLQWVKPGWQPLKLGYHCDWGPTEAAPGRVETIMANFGGCSLTEFVDDTFELPEAGDPRRRWRRWGDEVADRVARGELRTTRLQAEALVCFDNQAWHRPTPATAEGWRLLVRAIRGLDAARRHDGRGDFHSVRNGFTPTTPQEAARYAAYC